MQQTRIRSLGWEDPLEKEMATHFSILAWKIPWTEETGRLQSMGSQRVGHDRGTSLHVTLGHGRHKLWKGECYLLSCVLLLTPTRTVVPDPSLPGILLARTREWGAIPFFQGSSWPRDQTRVSRIAGRFLTIWIIREGLYKLWESCKLQFFFVLGLPISASRGTRVRLKVRRKE